MGGNRKRRLPAARSRVLSLAALARRLRAHRRTGARIVFTNGCFDLLHPGHVRYLEAARRLGDVLVVGINSDRSVRRLGKGSDRPVVPERDRAEVLAALGVVDYVVIFDEPTPLSLIRRLRPDVLVKGGDWSPHRIVGGEEVRSWGGRVSALPYAQGYSTSRLLERIRSKPKRLGTRAGRPGSTPRR